MLADQRSTTAVLSWLLGGFNNAGGNKMWFILPYALPAAVVVFLHGRLLNVLQLDEHQAGQLGVNVERTRIVVLVAASLAAAAPAVHAAKTSARAGAWKPVVPFIADDWPRALALAKARKLPVFIEGWAPW